MAKYPAPYEPPVISVYFGTLAELMAVINFAPILLEQIAHFFTHYKDLEPGKWVKVTGWEGVDKAKEMIEEGIKRLAGLL